MYNSLIIFKKNITGVRDLAALHEHLNGVIKAPFSFDDLLRFQIVYSVSAFDKLMHDLIRVGMVDSFIGVRTPTNKYLTERISLETYNSLSTANVPPKEYYFEQQLVKKLKIISYQDPDNVADGLSYIWSETNKWKKIADEMKRKEKEVRTELRLIIDRRNKIVHEADMDIATGEKFPILPSDCERSVSFLEECGAAIGKLVI